MLTCCETYAWCRSVSRQRSICCWHGRVCCATRELQAAAAAAGREAALRRGGRGLLPPGDSSVARRSPCRAAPAFKTRRSGNLSLGLNSGQEDVRITSQGGSTHISLSNANSAMTWVNGIKSEANRCVAFMIDSDTTHFSREPLNRHHGRTNTRNTTSTGLKQSDTNFHQPTQHNSDQHVRFSWTHATHFAHFTSIYWTVAWDFLRVFWLFQLCCQSNGGWLDPGHGTKILFCFICSTICFFLFAAVLQERYVLESHHQHHHHHSHLYSEPSFTDTDSVLQVMRRNWVWKVISKA